MRKLAVWAADDFEIFMQMMLQKNIELQLQALELLQQRYGVLPASLQPEGKKKEDENESKLMEEVARISKEEHEAHIAELNKEEAELEEVLAHSLDEHKRLVAAKQNQEILLAEHFSKVNITDPSGLIVSDIASPVTFASSEKVDPDDLARRTAFLKDTGFSANFSFPPSLLLFRCDYYCITSFKGQRETSPQPFSCLCPLLEVHLTTSPFQFSS